MLAMPVAEKERKRVLINYTGWIKGLSERTKELILAPNYFGGKIQRVDFVFKFVDLQICYCLL